MLAGNGASHLDAALEDFCAKSFGASNRLRVAIVEQDQRMKVAVAGVKNIGTTQRVLAFERLNGPKHFAESLARNGPIHAVVRGRGPSGCGKGVLATGPETQALGFT